MIYEVSNNALYAARDIEIYVLEESGFEKRAKQFTDGLIDYCAEVAKIATVR